MISIRIGQLRRTLGSLRFGELLKRPAVFFHAFAGDTHRMVKVCLDADELQRVADDLRLENIARASAQSSDHLLRQCND
jgi:hypothetical protein